MIWTQMRPVLFDSSLAPTKRARQVVQTAPQTLFPDLLPAPKPAAAAPVTDPLGTATMFDLEES